MSLIVMTLLRGKSLVTSLLLLPIPQDILIWAGKCNIKCLLFESITVAISVKYIIMASLTRWYYSILRCCFCHPTRNVIKIIIINKYFWQLKPHIVGWPQINQIFYCKERISNKMHTWDYIILLMHGALYNFVVF